MASISLSSLPSPLEVAADLLVPEETPAISPLDGDVWEAAGAEELNDCLLIISYYSHTLHITGINKARTQNILYMQAAPKDTLPKTAPSQHVKTAL